MELANYGWANHDGSSYKEELKSKSSGELVEANEINEYDPYQPVEGARGQAKYCTVNCLGGIGRAEVARPKA